MTGTAPGWYRDDPENPRTLRWHDGARWTQHTRDAAAPDVPPGPGPHPPAWTPAYGPPGSYPPPGPPPGAVDTRPPLPSAGPRPEDTQRQTLVALGVISVLLLGAIVVVIALLATYDPDGPVEPDRPERGNAAPAAPRASEQAPSTPQQPAADDTPEAVAEAFVTDLLGGRCEQAMGYLADELGSSASACEELPVPEGLGGMVEPRVEPARVDGDTARVAVGFAPQGAGDPLPGTRLVLQMVRQDDGWRIRDLTLR